MCPRAFVQLSTKTFSIYEIPSVGYPAIKLGDWAKLSLHDHISDPTPIFIAGCLVKEENLGSSIDIDWALKRQELSLVETKAWALAITFLKKKKSIFLYDILREADFKISLDVEY